MLYTKKTLSYEYPLEEAEVCLLGIPFDSTETGFPVRYGPLFIREAFSNIPGYDTELNLNIFEKLKFSDLGDIEVVPGNWDLTRERIMETVKEIIETNPRVFPIFLGGDHLITLGILEALKNKYKQITVVDFDAHRDLKPEWLGEKFSHITWAHHALNRGFDLIQIGCRSWDQEEIELVKRVRDRVEKTKNPVYITIDLDVLDPSQAPEVGTPEPNGMDFKSLLETLKAVFRNNVIGMDILECASQKVNTQTALLGANIIKKSLGWRFYGKG